MQQPEEFLEMGVGVVGSWSGFRVVLHSEHWKFFVANAFHRSVVQIDVACLKAGRTYNVRPALRLIAPIREEVQP